MYNNVNTSFLQQSPIQLLEDPILTQHQLKIWIKRDDLIHPAISGNKWRKLKYNLLAAQSTKAKALLTFGGAFSNHIYATAAACQMYGMPSIGIIRGEATIPLNPTLAFARQCGMKLHFVSRAAYRNKTEVLKQLNLDRLEVFVVSEGGANSLGLKGCSEIVEEVHQQLSGKLPEYWCLSCGTGSTMTGLISARKAPAMVHGFAALKGDFHREAIQHLIESAKRKVNADWMVHTNYHFGGYAKFDQRLIDFINTFKEQHGLSLDPIYTGKLFFGVYDLIQKGYFPRGSSLLLIHTGGLQGIVGFNQRFGPLIH